jgi:histidine ammonia-lyase
VGLIETSGGQEDAQSFGWEAAETLRQALRHARAVTSCEALTAYRALTLARRPVPAASRPLLASLAGILGPLAADRPFGEDIERLNASAWHASGRAGQDRRGHPPGWNNRS